MTVKVICPKCLEIAFEYYFGDEVDLNKRDIVFPKPMACNQCGYVVKKIKSGSGEFRRLE